MHTSLTFKYVFSSVNSMVDRPIIFFYSLTYMEFLWVSSHCFKTGDQSISVVTDLDLLAESAGSDPLIASDPLEESTTRNGHRGGLGIPGFWNSLWGITLINDLRQFRLRSRN